MRRSFAQTLGIGGVLAALMIAPVEGQEAGMLLLESPSSAESMAYGNAPYLFSSSPALLFQAPALLGRSSGFDFGLQRYGGDGTLASAAGAGEFQGGGFAIGVQYMHYGVDSGFPVDRDIQSVALTDGAIGSSEFVGTVGYAREFFGVRTGAALKYAEQSADGASDGVVAFDLGLAKDVGPLMVTLTGRNFGGDITLDPGPGGSTPTDLELPRQLIAGVSTQDFELGPLDMFVTSQVMRRRGGEYIPAGGVELSYWPVAGYTFRLRGGLQRVVEDERSPFTFGAAFTGDDITVEYAFQAFDEGGSGHRFGLRWR